MNTGLNLTDAIKNDLITKSVDQFLSNVSLEEYKKANPEVGKLLEELRKAEVNRENLRGMGEGVRAVMDIIGAMRSDFKNVEISHGSEQFNYGFTQPLDKEWVHINPMGEVRVIKSEPELINVFNKAKEQGRSMPPNPNWGWKLDEHGKYEKDQELKSLNERVDALMIKKLMVMNKRQQLIRY